METGSDPGSGTTTFSAAAGLAPRREGGVLSLSAGAGLAPRPHSPLTLTQVVPPTGDTGLDLRMQALISRWEARGWCVGTGDGSIRGPYRLGNISKSGCLMLDWCREQDLCIAGSCPRRL